MSVRFIALFLVALICAALAVNAQSSSSSSSSSSSTGVDESSSSSSSTGGTDEGDGKGVLERLYGGIPGYAYIIIGGLVLLIIVVGIFACICRNKTKHKETTKRMRGSQQDIEAQFAHLAPKSSSNTRRR